MHKNRYLKKRLNEDITYKNDIKHYDGYYLKSIDSSKGHYLYKMLYKDNGELICEEPVYTEWDVYGLDYFDIKVFKTKDNRIILVSDGGEMPFPKSFGSMITIKEKTRMSIQDIL